MIGLVLITHGEIGTSLRAAMEHVVGPQQQMETLSIAADDDIQARRRDLEAATDAVDRGDGAILLTDMFGSTPSNLAVAMLGRAGIEVIAGVNLPMLVKLGKIRSHSTLGECIDIAETAGRKYIAAASRLPEACLGGAACCQVVHNTAAAPDATEIELRSQNSRRVVAFAS
jgi:PTS system mannose-specific IIA component